MIPNVDIKADWKLLAVAGVILTGYVYALKWVAVKAGETGKDAAGWLGAAVDPTSPDNLAASGVAAVGEAVTGVDDWTPGTQLYDWGHEVIVDPETGQETITANPLGRALDWLTGVEL